MLIHNIRLSANNVISVTNDVIPVSRTGMTGRNVKSLMDFLCNRDLNEKLAIHPAVSSQCVTLGSILFSLWALYAPRVFCPLYDLQIFLYLDPSVSYSDDKGEGYLNDNNRITQMTPMLAFTDYAKGLMND